MENNIKIILPVKIGYPVLEKYLREKLMGEIIQKKKGNGEMRNFAQILELSLYKSSLANYDVALELELQTLTSLWKNRPVKLVFHAKLEFDRNVQQISISDYKMTAKSNSKIADFLLHGILNTWFYEKLKKRMNFDFLPEIASQLEKLNEKLLNQIETVEGVHLSGSLQSIEIEEITALEDHLHISLDILGDTSVEIKKIKF
ncbi:hypothetical protein C7S20_03375 [Christiangramia fulva]|uniref:DUF4403 domain-containing protein n=1 Tax=Christiangramia fulva TaxID=2126553 RepID=A0A2R3Z274_9FLAO|nr:DUF4403 family protein [Christiangramia fulva]AVR44373.1 hypothetical protein C7S20_03375 [Christiangramia fulva]